MSSVAVSAATIGSALDSARYSLFRLEVQAQYDVGDELAKARRFGNGDPLIPGNDSDVQEWCDLLRRWHNRGVSVGRVRVHDDPPTLYQRWVRWAAAWNIEAGEEMRYMTRPEARAVGLSPADQRVDWWLIDSSKVLFMHFDEQGRPGDYFLDSTPAVVAESCAWRDLAVHHSHPETLTGIALQGIS